MSAMMSNDLVLMVHPKDVNVADAKAEAAKRGVSVEPNPYVPRGYFYLMPRAPRLIDKCHPES